MRVISKRCLGLDLHKKQITAHLRVQTRMNAQPKEQTLQFGTMPDEIEKLREFVIEQKITDVVMESTSVYWMHVFERLEDVASVVVANASHVKKVPGRKTDVIDAQWLAEVGAHGLLRPSFIPPKPIRELRAWCRYRTRLVAMQTAVRNRTIKLLEMAGIKLSSVVADCFGVTGRRILDALCCSPRPCVAPLAVGTLREKLPQLQQCLGNGLLSDEQRQLLRVHLAQYDALEAHRAEVELRLSELAAPFDTFVQRLDEVPGINRLGAITLVAEVGTDMAAYRSAGHLTVLAGVAPGTAMSDVKRRRISVRKGNRYLKRILVQIAWAAARKKDSFLRARFVRLQRRIGRNKAIVALARQILVIVYHILGGATYRDLGANYYDHHQKDRATQNCVRRLQSLGFAVELKKLP